MILWIGCRDPMSDISMDTVASESGQAALHAQNRAFDSHEPGLGRPPAQPTLMTPESFTTSYSPRYYYFKFYISSLH